MGYMMDVEDARARGFLEVNPDASQRTPREELLHMGICNGLQPVNFTSDGWVLAFQKVIRETTWHVWRTSTGFTSACLMGVGTPGERYTQHEKHNSLRSALERLRKEERVN